MCMSPPAGRSRITLRKSGETYSLVPPNSKAHNVIVGRTWVDCYGDFRLANVTTGTQCHLYFTPCGWFGTGRYEVHASRAVVSSYILALLSGLRLPEAPQHKSKSQKTRRRVTCHGAARPDTCCVSGFVPQRESSAANVDDTADARDTCCA